MSRSFDAVPRREAGAVDDGPLLNGVDLTVQYEDRQGSFHHQVFANGDLRAWEQGPVADPDLWFRLSVEGQWAMLTRVGLGDDLLAATELVEPVTGGVVHLAPRDEVEVSWFAALPEIPGLPEIRVEQVLTESPFGDVAVGVYLRHGRVVRVWTGRTDGADVRVVRNFGAALQERMGMLDLLESLEGGRVDGDLRLVTLFLGIYEGEECVAARRKLTTPTCEPLIKLAEILSSPRWATVAAGLRGEAPPVKGATGRRSLEFHPLEDVEVSLP